MSENEEDNEKPFYVDKAKQGRATCKKCKEKCLTGEIRIAKLAYNPFGSGKLKQWYHVPCLFEQFLTQKIATKRLTDPLDLDGWDSIDSDNQNSILNYIKETEEKLQKKFGDKYKAQVPEIKNNSFTQNNSKETSYCNDINKNYDKDHKDNLFREFRRLTADVTNENRYLEKSAIMKNFLTNGSDGKGFKGDIIQWCRLLLPGVIKRIYNLQSKQLIKLFSMIFGTNRDEMLEHLEQGDIGETIQHFFENSLIVTPAKKSLLTIQEVDDFLEKLTELTKEEEQMEHFKKIVPKCTGNDLKVIIRLIKHDLRMNAGAKHVLDAVHPDAYQAFQASRDLDNVLKRVLDKGINLKTNVSQSVEAQIKVMTPVLPMLAEACKSVDQAMKRCPNGMYSEIKYDGERVQVHKHQSQFKYFSRSLKPVMAHKVSHFKDFIPKAFPHANDLILDSEVLLIDNKSGKPLPFGSLGVHKREEFKDANVCLFVFDCIYYNGESLMHKTMKERRRILIENMTEIPNRIMFSETEEVYKAEDLATMITKVLKLGLEGLVLKDMDSIYEPGKRHWLKVKKDYLCDGAMADSADLIVLGAWFGTGKKGGMMSIFLMGCYDSYTNQFYTVTKVHTGHDDKTLEQLQTELDMIKISGDPSKIPPWLRCNRQMVPDFVARDPKKQPIWEITGAEFTQHEVHTADGISIRFPRVTRIRSDKNWSSATNLQELKQLYKNSKEHTDFTLLVNSKQEDNTNKITSKQFNKTTINKKNKNSNGKVNNKSENGSDTEEEEVEDIDLIVKQTNENKRDLDEIKEESSKKFKSENDYNIDSGDSIIIGSREYSPVFRNIKIIVEEGVQENFQNVLGHFYAGGGQVVEEADWKNATYAVHSTDKYYTNITPKIGIRNVTIDWLRDSIGKQKILDSRPYTVQWLQE